MLPIHRFFLSFEADDAIFASQIDAWGANENNDFTSYNDRLQVSIDDRKADAVKCMLGEKIDRARALVCVVGEGTSWNRWVSWEISYANSAHKGLVGVLLEPEHRPPLELVNAVFTTCQEANIREAIGTAVILAALRR